jgi:hypothetical protein
LAAGNRVADPAEADKYSFRSSKCEGWVNVPSPKKRLNRTNVSSRYLTNSGFQTLKIARDAGPQRVVGFEMSCKIHSGVLFNEQRQA